MADDDVRVEARTLLVGMGMGTNPERLADLQRRAHELDQLRPKKPVLEFAQVLAKSGGVKESPPSAKEKKRQALPKRGPKPRLLHPDQKETFGREQNPSDPIVIKG